MLRITSKVVIYKNAPTTTMVIEAVEQFIC